MFQDLLVCEVLSDISWGSTHSPIRSVDHCRLLLDTCESYACQRTSCLARNAIAVARFEWFHALEIAGARLLCKALWEDVSNVSHPKRLESLGSEMG